MVPSFPILDLQRVRYNFSKNTPKFDNSWPDCDVALLSPSSIARLENYLHDFIPTCFHPMISKMEIEFSLNI